MNKTILIQYSKLNSNCKKTFSWYCFTGVPHHRPAQGQKKQFLVRNQVICPERRAEDGVQTGKSPERYQYIVAVNSMHCISISSYLHIK